MEDSVFVYKTFDKRGDRFQFLIVRMPDMSSNIPSTICYESILSELLRIARCSLRINVFLPNASYLFSRMMAQGGNTATLTKQQKKYFYQTVCQNFSETHEEVNINIMKNT